MKKFLGSFLLICMLASTLLTACQFADTPNETGAVTGSESVTDAPQTEPEANVLNFVLGGTTEFLIARPDSNCEDYIFNAFSDVKKLVKEYTGINLEMSYEATDGYELIVGNEGREELDEFAETYRIKDYFIGVVGNKLVIYANSKDAMDNAVAEFEAVLKKKADEDKTNISFSSKENIEGLYEDYLVDSLKIGKTEIKDYAIVYNPNGRYSEELLAIKLCKEITESVGYKLDIYKDTDEEAESVSNKIVIGKTAFSENMSAEGFDYHVEIKDENIYVYSNSIEGYDAVLESMLEQIAVGGDVEIPDTMSAKGTAIEPEKAMEIKSDLSSDIRVIIHNILGNCDVNKYPVPYRTRSVAELLVSYSPDVMGLQECSPNSRSSECNIVDVLSRYGYTEVPAQATNSKKSNYTPLFYNPKTVKVIECGYDYLEGTYNDGGSKSITWAVFEVIATGERFGACSTHFFYQSEADAGRVENAKQLSARCKAIYDKYGCPVIAGGDLNTRSSTEAFKTLLSNELEAIRGKAEYANPARTHHAYPEFSEEDGYYSTFTAPTADYLYSIDHVLVYKGDNLKFKNYYVVTEEYALMSSDHCPIVVDFNFNK